jgi:hypothetical protein
MIATRSFWPSFFSEIVARLQWEPMAIDLTPDARAWPRLPAERRRRLTTLLAGFCVAEDAVSEDLEPFGEAAKRTSMASAETLMAWVFFLQRRDEQRHARFFDRIAAEVLGLPGATPAERRAAARPYVPAAILELFEERLPAMTAELAASTTSWRGPRTRPRSGVTPSPKPRASAPCASASGGCRRPGSSRRARRPSCVVNGRPSRRTPRWRQIRCQHRWLPTAVWRADE